VSGIVAVLGAPAPSEEPAATAMLARLKHHGADQAGWWRGEAGLIGVSRAGWELGPGFSGGVLLLEEEGLVVAADASLYYTRDLQRALSATGARIHGDSPSHLIAASYRAWGDRLLDHLEGDFAFLLWDQRQRRLLAARDFVGSRPLYYAVAGDRLLLASSLPAVVAHPAVPRTLNRLAIAEDLIGASSMAVRDTAFSAVERLPAGARLIWQPGKKPAVERFWDPPFFDRNEGLGAAEAAEQLRDLLRAASKERLAVEGPTSVWTSGGFDSPAVFASAVAASDRDRVIPVSMSYPVGDPGREDELIQAVGDFVGTPIHWVDVASVPGLPEPLGWAERRDEPFAHPYEEWNRSLAAGSQRVGARVVLSGNGGDQFFGVSPVFLADLLKSLHWGELATEARAVGFGARNFRDFFHWAVQPALPPALFRLATSIRGGRPLRAHLQSPVPDWLEIDQQTSQQLWDRQWHYGLRRVGETLGSAETAWYLTSSFGQRIATTVVGFAQQFGAEVRSPMYDLRVLQFMSRRSRSDRFARGETKRLLRKAMEGTLPAQHLASRKSRTGLPSAYLHRVRLEALPRWVETAGNTLQLEALGLVTQAGVSGALKRYLANPEWEGRLAGQLFNVLTAEFWLRAHSGEGSLAVVKVA
jgi:asparagine synthetase B (glutamine-hydrolysing)